MTTIRRSSPIYIVRSDSKDDVYDAYPYPEENHLGEQLARQLVGQLVRGMPGSKDVAERVELPATGYAPGLPKNPPAGQQRSTGFGATAGFVDARPTPPRGLRRMPYFLVFTEEAAGDWIFFFHLPRKVVLKGVLLLALFLASVLLIVSLGNALIG